MNCTYSDINIEDCIFHGINLHYYQKTIDELAVFRKILNSKKILTRKDLLSEETYNDIIPRIHEQSDDEVCLISHPKNTELRHLYIGDDKFVDIFFQYIRFNISFIFSDKLFDKKDLKILYNGEIRGIGSLKLDDKLLAIGCFNEIDYLDEKTSRLNCRNLCFAEELINSKNLQNYVLAKKARNYAIEQILKEENYNIPIVDPYTGIEIKNDFDSDVQKAKQLKMKLG